VKRPVTAALWSDTEYGRLPTVPYPIVVITSSPGGSTLSREETRALIEELETLLGLVGE
jgi:hypothetical protein